MTSLLIAALALGAALLQVGAVPTIAINTVAAPLVPIALLAAWGTVRRSTEVWPALLASAAILGVASEQRAGWYLLALLPTGVALLAPSSIQTPSHRLTGRPSFLGRIARAPVVAAAGAWAYLATLLVAAGEAPTIANRGAELMIASLWTGLLAVAFALVLWPLRGQNKSLFR